MKLKAAVSSRAPAAIHAAFASEEFAQRFFEEVVDGCFGIPNACDRPAEYYVQLPDQTIQVGRAVGVEVRLSGVSRGEREPKLFHDALEKLEQLVISIIKFTLGTENCDPGVEVDTFVVLMVDNDVPSPPSGSSEFAGYAAMLESPAKRVSAGGVEVVEKD